MANGNGITAQETIRAIRDSKGLVTTIAKRLNCTRRHVYRLLDKYSTAKEALDDEREQLKDFAESKLWRQIDNENMTAIIFYLKTQAKDRGYVERQELALVEKELEQMLDALENKLDPETFQRVVKAIANDSH